KLFTTLHVNSPSFSGRIVPLFDSMLTPQGEGSGTPTEPHHTPSPEAQQTSHTTHSSPTLPPVTTTPIPTVTPSDTPHLRQYTRRARIAQSSDRANIAKTSTLPGNSTPRVTSLAADKGNQSGNDAPIKGRRLDEGEEAVERVSDDTEEMATVLTSMDAATVLSSGVAEVPTGSGSIPTADPTGSDVVPTAGLNFSTATVVTPYTKRKGKEKLIESETPKKKKIQESNETVAKYLQEYHLFATELPIERRIELISDLVRGIEKLLEDYKAGRQLSQLPILHGYVEASG
nr:hypothetical protein [Tanacetum cinerariifolium]